MVGDKYIHYFHKYRRYMHIRHVLKKLCKNTYIKYARTNKTNNIFLLHFAVQHFYLNHSFRGFNHKRLRMLTTGSMSTLILIGIFYCLHKYRMANLNQNCCNSLEFLVLGEIEK